MTRIQKLIITASLTLIIILQHWPVTAADTTMTPSQKVDEYMACMAGRASISLYADYSNKGLNEAIRYAHESCQKEHAFVAMLKQSDKEKINGQLVEMYGAMTYGMRKLMVNAESNEHEPSDADIEANDHSPIRGFIMARKHARMMRSIEAL